MFCDNEDEKTVRGFISDLLNFGSTENFSEKEGYGSNPVLREKEDLDGNRQSLEWLFENEENKRRDFTQSEIQSQHEAARYARNPEKVVKHLLERNPEKQMVGTDIVTAVIDHASPDDAYKEDLAYEHERRTLEQDGELERHVTVDSGPGTARNGDAEEAFEREIMVDEMLYASDEVESVERPEGYGVERGYTAFSLAQTQGETDLVPQDESTNLPVKYQHSR